jgi:hypothetical protein
VEVGELTSMGPLHTCMYMYVQTVTVEVNNCFEVKVFLFMHAPIVFKFVRMLTCTWQAPRDHIEIIDRCRCRVEETSFDKP